MGGAVEWLGKDKRKTGKMLGSDIVHVNKNRQIERGWTEGRQMSGQGKQGGEEQGVDAGAPRRQFRGNPDARKNLLWM